MGLDLTLLSVTEAGSMWFAHTMVQTARAYELYEEIKKLKSSYIPGAFWSYVAHDKHGETVYGEVTRDPYGELLTWVRAIDLAKLHAHQHVTSNWVNRAAWAFLQQLPDDHKVVLWWH